MEYVYALIKDNMVVYVGRSKNVKKRVYAHSDKDFDSYEILIETDCKKEIVLFEDHFIKHYNPKYNKKLNNSGVYISLDYFVYKNKLELDEVLEITKHLINHNKKPLFANNFKYDDLLEAMLCNESKRNYSIPAQVYDIDQYIREHF